MAGITALPPGELGQRRAQHPGADGNDLPGRLGEGDERHRRHDRTVGFVPAQQRLEAGDEPVLQAHGRLVDLVEFGVDRDAECLEGAG